MTTSAAPAPADDVGTDSPPKNPGAGVRGDLGGGEETFAPPPPPSKIREDRRCLRRLDVVDPLLDPALFGLEEPLLTLSPPPLRNNPLLEAVR